MYSKVADDLAILREHRPFGKPLLSRLGHAEVDDLDRRGWRTKRWRTRKGHERGGRRFTRNHLRQLLSNVTYTGQVRYHHEVHSGEHSALIDPTTFAQVQALLQRNRQEACLRLGQAAVLQGILYCCQCGVAMTARAAQESAPQVRSYVCTSRLPGQPRCPVPPLPARPIEHLVRTGRLARPSLPTTPARLRWTWKTERSVSGRPSRLRVPVA